MDPISILPTQTTTKQCLYIPLSPETNSGQQLDPLMFSIMNYQNFLNLELLKNQSLIATYMTALKEKEKQKLSCQNASITSEGMDNSNTTSLLFHSCLQLKHQNQVIAQLGADEREISCQHRPKIVKKQKKITPDSDYEPQKSDTENYKLGKSSQSKNVPKNFSKAILLFMKRKQNKIKQIVEQNGHNFEDFLQAANALKGKINSIAELRSLWLEQQNKFAKIFRIISNYYLKRFSLEHIFNSRVEDFTKHLKYRNKMSQVLKNPQEFTRMKDY